MNRDQLTEAFLQAAAESGDTDRIVAMVEQLQEITVSMFSLYILLEAKEHEGHDTDCEVMAKLPGVVDSFCSQFEHDLRMHVEMNCKVNGITLVKTHNQQTFEDIMRELDK